MLAISPLPEMKKIVKGYDLGIVNDDFDMLLRRGAGALRSRTRCLPQRCRLVVLLGWSALVVSALIALAASIHSIQSQTAVPSDLAALTDNLIRQKISQVFPANVAQTFMGMWSGTIQYTAAPVSSLNVFDVPK